MQPDVNQAKSKAFNIHLRFFQLSLCLLATFLVDRVFNITCVQQTFQVINVMGISLAVVSLGSMIFETFRRYHNKTVFAITYGLNLLFCAVILIFSGLNYHASSTCPTKTILYVYYLTNIPLYIALSLMIMFMPFFWVQRFTNSPGSAVWPFLFFYFAGQTIDTLIMVLIGLLTVASNILTWSTNGLALLNGVSTFLKKLMWVCFIISLVFTGVSEILALIIVFSMPKVDFTRTLIKSMLEIFVFVNFIDLLFWFLGLMSLNYENGDVVRDGLLDQGEAEKEEEVQGDEYAIHYGSLI
jgi:hypothetical protein